MQCFNRKFLDEARFVYDAGGEKPGAAPKGTSETTQSDDEAARASRLVAGALSTCDEFTCKVEVMAKKPWQEQTTKILEKIGQDRSATLAFNTFLQEYARSFGGSVEFTDDVASNFYDALSLARVPDSEIGFNNALNAILLIARESVADSSVKSPYEKLKSIVDEERKIGGN